MFSTVAIYSRSFFTAASLHVTISTHDNDAPLGGGESANALIQMRRRYTAARPGPLCQAHTYIYGHGWRRTLRRAEVLAFDLRRAAKSFVVSLWDILTTEQYSGTVEPTLPQIYPVNFTG